MFLDQIWRNREGGIIGGVVVPFISKADLILSKQKAGRLRDPLDVEELLLRRNIEPGTDDLNNL